MPTRCLGYMPCCVCQQGEIMCTDAAGWKCNMPRPSWSTVAPFLQYFLAVCQYCCKGYSLRKGTLCCCVGSEELSRGNGLGTAVHPVPEAGAWAATWPMAELCLQLLGYRVAGNFGWDRPLALSLTRRFGPPLSLSHCTGSAPCGSCTLEHG